MANENEEKVWMSKRQFEQLKKCLELAQNEIFCQNCFYKLAERMETKIAYNPNDVGAEFVELDTDRIKIIFKCPECLCRMEILS